MEQGYELEKKPPLEMEALSDDDLENVAGGIELADAFCEFVMWLIMEDDYICYNRICLEED